MEKTITVSELNEYARALLAGDPILRDVTVTGEISGYTRAFSGHRYFSLKDPSSKIDCAMWRSAAMGLDFEPENGQKVTARGSVSIYPKDGRYQFYVGFMSKSGLGDLYVCFEQLKNRLSAEGLFDPARKKEIPFFPRKLGLVTSETGAAVRDMIRVARRRNPNIEIVLSACSVQGEAAVPEIVRAIQRINDRTDCDVILLGRGGGSMEDLWAFNEEAVARAIAASRIPIISCVGHEIDFTISDFVADLRAATPSHAAELAVPMISELRATLGSLSSRLETALANGQDTRRTALKRIAETPIMSRPAAYLTEPYRQRLRTLSERLDIAYRHRLAIARERLESVSGMLRMLDPRSVMSRGYAILRDEDGTIRKGITELTPNTRMLLELADGIAHITIEDTEGKRNVEADV